MSHIDLSKTESYNYLLPPELIAQYPIPGRSGSRLCVVNKSSGKIEHKNFTDIFDHLNSGDVLVLNKTKVIPARLFGHKTTGAKAEVFLLNQLEEDVWECLVKPGRRLPVESEIIFDNELKCKVLSVSDEGTRRIKFYWEGDFFEVLNKIGNMPLPPYISRAAEEKDKETYQTVYARNKGSVAAPTAGLHFTDNILKKLKAKGVLIAEVILHVGLGTFRPVKTDNIANHKMHSEFCTISEETANKINKAKDEGRRIISVGTTTTRTLESFAENGFVKHGSHFTEIFIYPGKKLQIIDGLITNFHMPKSTLMMLVSAFGGYENIMNAYKQAVDMEYRFFSYGDSMLII